MMLGRPPMWSAVRVPVPPAGPDARFDGPFEEFDAPLEVLAWGRNDYVVLYLDELVEDAAVTLGTRRVEGWLDDVAVNLGINRADVVDRPFLYAGAGLRRRLGARAGDLVTCRLRPADPDHVPVDDDVLEALERAGRLGVFERLRPAQRRVLLKPVEDAARLDTRRRRIEVLVRSLDPA